MMVDLLERQRALDEEPLEDLPDDPQTDTDECMIYFLYELVLS